METSKKPRKHLLFGLAAGFTLAGLAYAVYWASYARYHASTDDAYVGGNLVQLMPQVSGNVVSVLADDTHWVKMGQPLVKLDGEDAKVAVEKAEAELSDAIRSVKQLHESRAEQQANLNLRQIEAEKAEEDFRRRQGIGAEHAVSQEELRHAEKAAAIARQQLEVARHQLMASDALLGATPVARHPRVLKAIAALREACLARSRLSIQSPADGFVAKRSVQVGQRVNPGTPLMVIVPLEKIWADANFKEDELQHIRIGQSAVLYSDLYGKEVKYHGKVIGLGAGTGSVFSLLPPQNATGNWIKVVQRVPVRIALDPSEIAQHPLQVGLSLSASIDTHDRSGQALAKSQPAQSGYSTSVFAGNDAEIERRIRQILRDNGADPERQ